MPAAVGAVFIAAVGVWGVFKMAFYVASETGRSINADKADGSSESSSSGGGGGSGVQPASPLERPWWQPRQQQQAGEWVHCSVLILLVQSWLM